MTDARPKPHHNHRACIASALNAAEKLCAGRGEQLTELRRRVLELVWAGHKPVGAYQILNSLREDGRSAAPPTVYRALDFLLAQGLVHRVESLNAFIGCPHPGEAHATQFLICKDCGTAVELDDPGIDRAIDGSAARLGFAIAARTVEISGTCADCRAR
ncbi:MAG: transcriptional repressor [Alphaproteobacteria bacterium]|nr:transcriptional repressor [Alphaproteobacteria bacterium]